MRQVRFPPRAIADLRDIHAFEAGTRPLTADLLIGRLVDRAMSLRDFAHRGSPRARLGRSIRVIGEGDHLIFYRIGEDDEVLVLRILHGARRITRSMLRQA